ncbi:hypothetical protein ACFQ07_19915 [Actinomadura adrarensis]|uniref:DUF4267 domain-containing protein n=1 Tax=Actinomadura adrarensis TaxID=1819600 RepID=A0ABW3CJE2_9ACTN
MERVLEMAACGRIVWGALALAAPGLNTKLAGVGDKNTPEVRYLIRVFGSRAVALGAGYLLSDAEARRKWRRLALMVDVCDTAAGTYHLIRGDVSRGAAAGLVTITGGYAALGLLGLAADRKR